MTYEEAGGDALGARVQELLLADYLEAGRVARTPAGEIVAVLDDGSGVWLNRTLFDILQGGLSEDASVEKHRREWRQGLGLEQHTNPQPIDLPARPTREQVCSLVTHLQGLMVPINGTQYPAGFFWWKQSPEGRRDVYSSHRAVNDTHIPISVSSAYKEPGTLLPPELLEGDDFTQRLPEFKLLLREIICAGLFPDVPLAGDGESNPNGGYNDDVGKGYGHDWLMANFERIAKALRGDGDSECPDGEDLTPYILFRPGWDGVFYGWEPSRVKLGNFGELFRRVLPNGYLAIEHSTGHIPAGEGGDDWGANGCMRHYDTLLTEFDAPLLHNENVWQIGARTLGPAYHKPSDQPPNADRPNPPWYMSYVGPRGPYFVVGFEFDTYHWFRGRISLQQVEADRAYLRTCGYHLIG